MARNRRVRILTAMAAAAFLVACGDGGSDDGGGGSGPPGAGALEALTEALVEDLDKAPLLDEATLLAIFPAPIPIAEPVISYAHPVCKAYKNDIVDLTEFDGYTPPLGAGDKHLLVTVEPDDPDDPDDATIPDGFRDYLEKGILFGMQRWEEHHADFSLFDMTNPNVSGIPMKVVVDTDLEDYIDPVTKKKNAAAFVLGCANQDDLPLNDLDQPVDKSLCNVELHVPYDPATVTNEDNDRRWMGTVSVSTLVHEVAHIGQDYIQLEGPKKLLAYYHSGFDWAEEGHAMFLERRSPDACAYSDWAICPIEILKRGAREWGNLPANVKLPDNEGLVPYTAGTFLDQITERAFGGSAGWMGDWFAFQVTKPAVVLMIEAITEEVNSPHLDFHLFQRLFVESAMDLWIPLENLQTQRTIIDKGCFGTVLYKDLRTALPLTMERKLPVISTDAVAVRVAGLPAPDAVAELEVSLGIDRNPGNIRAAALAVNLDAGENEGLFTCLGKLDEEELVTGGATALLPCHEDNWIIPLGAMKPSNGHRIRIPMDPAEDDKLTPFLESPGSYHVVVILFNLLLGPDPDSVLEPVTVTVRIAEPAGPTPAAETVTAVVEIPDFVVPFEPDLEMGYNRDIDGTDHPAVIASNATTYGQATDFNTADLFTTLRLSLDATAIAGPGTYGCGDGTGGGLSFSTPTIGHERTSMTSNVLFLATGGTYTIEAWGTEAEDRVAGSFDCAVSGKRTVYSEDAGDFVSADVEGTVAGTFDVSLQESGTY